MCDSDVWLSAVAHFVCPVEENDIWKKTDWRTIYIESWVYMHTVFNWMNVCACKVYYRQILYS